MATGVAPRVVLAGIPHDRRLVPANQAVDDDRWAGRPLDEPGRTDEQVGKRLRGRLGYRDRRRQYGAYPPGRVVRQRRQQLLGHLGVGEHVRPQEVARSALPASGEQPERTYGKSSSGVPQRGWYVLLVDPFEQQWERLVARQRGQRREEPAFGVGVRVVEPGGERGRRRRAATSHERVEQRRRPEDRVVVGMGDDLGDVRGGGHHGQQDRRQDLVVGGGDRRDGLVVPVGLGGREERRRHPLVQGALPERAEDGHAGGIPVVRCDGERSSNPSGDRQPGLVCPPRPGLVGPQAADRGASWLVVAAVVPAQGQRLDRRRHGKGKAVVGQP